MYSLLMPQSTFNLTPEQRKRQAQSIRRHYERQTLINRRAALHNREPEVRMSPYKGRPRFVSKDFAQSLRVCVEHPDHPNEYLYLYRFPDDSLEHFKRFAWLTSHYVSPKFKIHDTYETLMDAILAVSQSGYLDASW